VLNPSRLPSLAEQGNRNLAGDAAVARRGRDVGVRILRRRKGEVEDGEDQQYGLRPPEWAVVVVGRMYALWFVLCWCVKFQGRW